MASAAADHTDPYLGTYRTVPKADPGVCVVCRSGPNSGFNTCRSCDKAIKQVTRPTRHVVPISLYKIPSQLHHVLRYYKDGPSEVAAPFKLQVAAMLSRFLEFHERCAESLSGGSFTLVTNVPSTRGKRLGTHPLVEAIRLVRRLTTRYSPTLTPTATVQDRQASDSRFSPSRRVSGERVLLIDDTFTTGARVQSAASTLHIAGATSVTALVVGRVINPDWNDNCGRIWEESESSSFTFDRCCLCT